MRVSPTHTTRSASLSSCASHWPRTSKRSGWARSNRISRSSFSTDGTRSILSAGLPCETAFRADAMTSGVAAVGQERLILELTEHIETYFPRHAIPESSGELLASRFGKQIDVEFPTPRTAGR